jgi:hypothetical protein
MSHREPTPQEAQRDGQGAVAQDNPLRELHQDGEAFGQPQRELSRASRELTDEEVSVLCDIGTGAPVREDRQPVIRNLIERGFIVSGADGAEPPALNKLTARGQKTLSMRGAGLNES